MQTWKSGGTWDPSCKKDMKRQKDLLHLYNFKQVYREHFHRTEGYQFLEQEVFLYIKILYVYGRKSFYVFYLESRPYD